MQSPGLRRCTKVRLGLVSLTINARSPTPPSALRRLKASLVRCCNGAHEVLSSLVSTRHVPRRRCRSAGLGPGPNRYCVHDRDRGAVRWHVWMPPPAQTTNGLRCLTFLCGSSCTVCASNAACNSDAAQQQHQQGCRCRQNHFVGTLQALEAPMWAPVPLTAIFCLRCECVAA